jgi:hypothetical protein
MMSSGVRDNPQRERAGSCGDREKKETPLGRFIEGHGGRGSARKQAIKSRGFTIS